MGIRTSLQIGAVKGRHYKKQGKPSPAEKAIVAAVVLDSPAEVTPAQITGLATALRRTPAAIKKLVAEAREMLVSSAGDYVRMHKQAVEAALIHGQQGDAKALDVAVKASQWAIQNITQDGQRIVDKASTEPQGQKIFIGIRVGAMDQKPAVRVAEVIDAPGI